MSYWMLYPRCMAAKPVVCKFSTSFLLCEGCFLVAEIAYYVLKTRLCVSLADRWSSLAWTINTCEVVVSKHLVILLWKVTWTLFQYCGKQSCSHNTLPSFPNLTPPHLKYFRRGITAGAFTAWEAVCMVPNAEAITWGLGLWQRRCWLRLVPNPLDSIS